MPATPHIEKHFTGSATVRDAVIGMADGLTVPFALAAGLSAAVSSTSLIVTAGLAEIAAGAMAMGLGGYLAAKTDAEHYQAELAREQHEIDNARDHEVGEGRGNSPRLRARRPWAAIGGRGNHSGPPALHQFPHALRTRSQAAGPETRPHQRLHDRYVSAGGLVPLIPYMLTKDLWTALQMSVGMTAVALFIFGAVKGHFTGANRIKSAAQTLLVGGIAAGAAFALAHAFG